MERRRLGDRVHPVERMGQVDKAALGADRLDGLAEGHASRDLLAQEEPDHLALVGRLHLFARDHDEAAAARPLDRLERAAEDVVVGDRDRAEPLRLGMVEELVDVDRAVVRPVGVQVEVGDYPFLLGLRRAGGGATPAGGEPLVNLLDAVGEHLGGL